MGDWEDCEATHATNETNNSGSHTPTHQVETVTTPNWCPVVKEANNLQRCQILCLFNFDQFWK